MLVKGPAGRHKSGPATGSSARPARRSSRRWLARDDGSCNDDYFFFFLSSLSSLIARSLRGVFFNSGSARGSESAISTSSRSCFSLLGSGLSFLSCVRYPRLKHGGLCLSSTAVQHTWKGVLLWLRHSTHQGQLTTAPYASSPAG